MTTQETDATPDPNVHAYAAHRALADENPFAAAAFYRENAAAIEAGRCAVRAGAQLPPAPTPPDTNATDAAALARFKELQNKNPIAASAFLRANKDAVTRARRGAR